MYLWKELSFIGNYEYYADIDSYMRTVKDLIRLIKALVDNKNVDKYIERFQKSFEHENIQVVYPSMHNYNDEEMDYTLILLENLTNIPDINDLNKEIFDDGTLSLNEQVDRVISRLFKDNSELMKKSLIAIKLGKSKIDLNDIVKGNI